MVTINIDGKDYDVEKGQNILQACQTLGLEIPYFCWHPALGSVGSCRQCAITMFLNEDDNRGRIIMSCMTPVADGQRLSLSNPQVKKFRSLLIEATMTNHPHDCPVCEEGGECHLQDITLLSGHINRRYRGPKRTHNNQYLGPFVNHEMNRCISCYRCVRYYRDYCGGSDLNVFASRNNVFFGRATDGPFDNEFSGNLVEVCPTGVFTDKTFSQHYCRKWELQSSPSVCIHCSVGCNIHPGERNGTLRRITNRFHPDINGHFLCDRGRFGYEFVNDRHRTTHPWQRNYEQRCTDQLSYSNAIQSLQNILDDPSNQNVIAVGSSRSSLENNFALRKLVGINNFYSDLKEPQHIQLKKLITHYQQHQGSSSLLSLEAADVALLIGEDITQTAPRMALSLRQMIKNAGKAKAANFGIQYWSAAEVKNITQDLTSALHIITSHQTQLDDIACSRTFAPPSEQVRLIHKVISYLRRENTIQSDHELERESDKGVEIELDPSQNQTLDNKAKKIAIDLRLAHNPFIITGINHANEALVATTLQLHQALREVNPNAGLLCALPQANSLAISLLSLTQQHIDSFLLRLDQNPPNTLIILETDLYRCCAAAQLEKRLNRVKNIIVLDHLLTPTGEQADLLLPTTSFAEYHGSWINYEGRIQASVSCFPPSDDRRPAYHWLTNGSKFHRLIRELAGSSEQFSDLPTLYPGDPETLPVARKSIRESGRTAVNAVSNVKESPPETDTDSPYQYSQEGVASNVSGEISPAYYWSPGWNSNESLASFQETVNGPVRYAHPGIILFQHSNKKNSNVDIANEYHTNDFDDNNNFGLQLLPYHHIFSDEELSSYVTSIQQQMPRPSIKLNHMLAQQWGFEENTQLDVIDQATTNKLFDNSLPLIIDKSVPDGVALVPANLFIGIYPPNNSHILLRENKSEQVRNGKSNQKNLDKGGQP